MKWEESLDKLEKIITKNINVYKKQEEVVVSLLAEKKDISGPLLKVELPILDKIGRISAREISQKFKVPEFSNLKRLTPIQTQNVLNTQILTQRPKVAPICKVFEEESINTLENESQNHAFLFDIDAFVDVEFLSKSKNVVFYPDSQDPLLYGKIEIDGIEGEVEEIYYKDYTVLIKCGHGKILKGISFVKLVSEKDETYHYRISNAGNLRNEFEYNSILYHVVKCMMKEFKEKMPRLSTDLIKRIQSKSNIILLGQAQDDILADLEDGYIYSQTKAWILSNNIFKR